MVWRVVLSSFSGFFGEHVLIAFSRCLVLYTFKLPSHLSGRCCLFGQLLLPGLLADPSQPEWNKNEELLTAEESEKNSKQFHWCLVWIRGNPIAVALWEGPGSTRSAAAASAGAGASRKSGRDRQRLQWLPWLQWNRCSGRQRGWGERWLGFGYSFNSKVRFEMLGFGEIQW